MTRILKSKYKIDRRLKCNLWGRPKSPFNRRDYPPGHNGQNKRRMINLNKSFKIVYYYNTSNA